MTGVCLNLELMYIIKLDQYRFNCLQPEVLRNNIYNVGFLLTNKSICLRHRHQPINAICGDKAVYFQNYKKQISKICGQHVELFISKNLLHVVNHCSLKV
jgi:hypothetical protein